MSNQIIEKDKIVHDINASLSALFMSLEVVKDEWRTNPELVDRLLPLTLDKIAQLQSQLHKFNQ